MTATTQSGFELPKVTLDVLTLNTWGFRWPLAKHRKRRFKRISRHLDESQYDIVALQELWAGAPEALLNETLQWALPADTRRANNARMVDSGLGVQLPDRLRRGAKLLGDSLRRFSRAASWDRLKTKGLLAVEVPVETGPVAVLNTHLQAGLKHAPVRRSQLDQILEAAESISAPVLLMGDFNFHGNSAEDVAAHRALRAHGFRDASEELDRPDATYRPDNPYVPNSECERFDRLYVRDGAHVSVAPLAANVIVDQAAPMSDHEALHVRLGLRRR